MDIVNAIHINSWLEDAKKVAKEKGCKVWLKRDGGGFAIVTQQPPNPVAEIWPGGRTVLLER